MLSTGSISAILAGTALILTTAAQPEAPRCIVTQNLGRCVVEAADPAREDLGQPTIEPTPANDTSSDTSDSDLADDPPFVPLPIPEFRGGPGQPVVTGQQEIANGALVVNEQPAAVAPEVQPEVLAQRAISALDLLAPVPHLSANGPALVGVPLWAWIDGGVEVTGPVAATAVAGGSSVTATATLARVRWEMGPPGEVVVCSGPGTPWTGQAGESPDCGYTYTQRSTPERTGGSGAWSVTATAQWFVVWSGVSAGVPVEGVETVELTSVQALEVGEVQVLTVGGGG